MTFPPRRGQHRRIIRQQLTVLRWCFYDQYVVRVAGICFKEVLHIIRQIAAHTGRFPRGAMHIREILAIPPSRQLAQRQFGVYAIQFGHIRHVCGISFQKFSQITAEVGPHKIGGLGVWSLPPIPSGSACRTQIKTPRGMVPRGVSRIRFFTRPPSPPCGSRPSAGAARRSALRGLSPRRAVRRDYLSPRPVAASRLTYLA